MLLRRTLNPLDLYTCAVIYIISTCFIKKDTDILARQHHSKVRNRKIKCGEGYGIKHHYRQYFIYIVAVSFIGG